MIYALAVRTTFIKTQEIQFFFTPAKCGKLYFTTVLLCIFYIDRVLTFSSASISYKTLELYVLLVDITFTTIY